MNSTAFPAPSANLDIWPVHGDDVVVTLLDGKSVYGWFHDAKSTDTEMAIVPNKGATRKIPTSQIYAWQHYNWGPK